MELNKHQKRVVIVALALIILMFLFPPWTFRLGYNVQSYAGIWPIWNPPTQRGSFEVVAILDSSRLLIHWLAVCIIGGGIVFLRK